MVNGTWKPWWVIFCGTSKKKKPINPSLALPGAHTFKRRTRMECPVHLKCTGLLCILLWHPVLLPGLSTRRHCSLCIIKHKQAKTLSTVVQYLLLWFYSFSIFSIEHIDWHLSSTSPTPCKQSIIFPWRSCVMRKGFIERKVEDTNV